MKKSDITFYGICLLAGIFNPGYGLWFSVAVIAIAGTLSIIVKNKYERA